MQRRSFLKTGVTAGGLAALGVSTKPLLAHVPPHNFDRYDFGSGPAVSERLYQGPFYADEYPSWNVVMALTPSREIVPNYGMGLITYVCDEAGPAKKERETLAESIEKLVKIPLGTKLYIRVNWKDVQRDPGQLGPCDGNQRPNVVCSQLTTGLSYRDATKSGGSVLNQDCFGDPGDNQQSGIVEERQRLPGLQSDHTVKRPATYYGIQHGVHGHTVDARVNRSQREMRIRPLGRACTEHSE